MKDKIFMNMAVELSKASKCVSKQVGAIIVKDGRIVSTGYNGTPSGYKNCCDHWNNVRTEEHHEWSKMYEIHAEMNAIIYAAKEGNSIKESVIYCTLEPCSECSKNLIQSGIKEIVYLKSYEYNDTQRINDFLKENNIIKRKLKEG